MLEFHAPAPLLKPPNALSLETAGWAERLKAGLASFGDGLGRLIVDVRVAGRVAGVAWELQPRRGEMPPRGAEQDDELKRYIT